MDRIITLLAVALGWLLSELSTLLRLRREDRRAAGPLLSDLLEIRHRLVALDAFRKELGKQVQIPAQAQLQVQQYIRALVPDPPRFAEKYAEAVSALARVDPIRAFRLRGQPLIGPLLAQLAGLAASDQAASGLWIAVAEPKLLGLLVPHLEELILDVAGAHGWRTWWRVRRRLREPVLSRSDKERIFNFLAEIKKASGSAAGA
jgi:hypothetical protein